MQVRGEPRRSVAGTIALLGLLAAGLFPGAASGQTPPAPSAAIPLPPPISELLAPRLSATPGDMFGLGGAGPSRTKTGSVAPGRTALGAERRGATVPFALEGGWIIVEVVLDGQAPRPFIFDTGAVTTISPEVAAELKGKDRDTAILVGVGPGKLTATATRAHLALGDAQLGDQKIWVTELPNRLVDRGSRPRAAGLLGSELLAAYVVRIDYGNRILKLIPSGGFAAPADAIPVPLKITMAGGNFTRATLPVEIDRVPAQLVLDTGNSGQLALARRFERAHHLLDGVAKRLSWISPGGIGGRFRIELGLGREFTIGGVTLTQPLLTRPADLRDPRELTNSEDDRGGFRAVRFVSDADDGLLGAGILSHFIVTLDYGHASAYFEPLGRPRLTTTISGTGLEIDKPRHEDFEIIDILPASPAERAGLHVGDRIVRVNDRPASDLSVSDFVQLTSAPVLRSAAVDMEDGHHAELQIVQMLP